MKYISIKSFYDIKLKILEDKNNKLLEIIKKQKIIISQISHINQISQINTKISQ